MQAKLMAMLGAVGVLALAYALDAWMERVRRLLSRTFDGGLSRLIPWYDGLAYLLLVAVLVIVAWWIYERTERGWLLGLTLFVIGLPAAFAYVVWINVPGVWPFNGVPNLGPAARFSLTGAFLA